MESNLETDDLIWVPPTPDEEWQQKIIDEFNIHPVTAQILISRGFRTLEEIHNYLYAKLPNLIPPELFPQMDKAVNRVFKALQNKENILIYGDNDVDGITGTALLVEYLRLIGADTYFYVPNRNTLKNSIIIDALEFAKKNNCTLLITVDCGITAVNEIEQVVAQGVDVIITDHHEPISAIPHCAATLNPKLLDSTYPNRDLTGVGVAFKLAHALTNFLVKRGEISTTKIDLKRYLDLVALGTIADMGALLGENRILVRYGLRQLNQTTRIGLIKLLQISELSLGNITTMDIASKVAPRINSLGRIADPIKGIELLLLRDAIAAEKLAQDLDLNNIERQKIERKDSEDIEQYMEKHPHIFKEKAIVLASDKWHPGIIPILTARIAKQYNRPTLIIAIEDGVGKGSIRTIPEFPILATLRENSSYLINFGGHDFAAGLTINEENIEEFRKKFIASANTILKNKDILPKLQLDGFASFNELTFDFLESMSLLEPYGTGNPPPVLYCEAKQAWAPKIVGKMHLKFYLEQDERFLEGIGFGLADRKAKLTKKNLKLHIAYTPHVNTFLSKSSIQLQIKDFKILNP